MRRGPAPGDDRVPLAPDDPRGRGEAVKRGPQIDGLHPVGEKGVCHRALGGAQVRVAAPGHGKAHIAVGDDVFIGDQPAQPGGKAFGTAGAADARQGGAVDIGAKTRRRDQRQRGDAPRACIGDAKRQRPAKAVADQVGLVEVQVVEGAADLLQERGETRDFQFRRFAMARQVDADDRAMFQMRLKRRP